MSNDHSPHCSNSRNAPNSTAAPAFLRLRDVIRISALSRSTIYRRIAEGTLPAQVALGGPASAWRSEGPQDLD